MPNISSVAPAFKLAVYEAARALWAESDPDVLVSFGHPGQSQPDDIVGLMDIRSQQDPATIGSNRSREEILELDVLVSIYRGGGPEAEIACTARGYELLGALEVLVRSTDTTLGGVVRECFLIGHTSDGSTDPAVLAKGRVIEITATFQAKARISNA